MNWHQLRTTGVCLNELKWWIRQFRLSFNRFHFTVFVLFAHSFLRFHLFSYSIILFYSVTLLFNVFVSKCFDSVVLLSNWDKVSRISVVKYFININSLQVIHVIFKCLIVLRCQLKFVFILKGKIPILTHWIIQGFFSDIVNLLESCIKRILHRGNQFPVK